MPEDGGVRRIAGRYVLGETLGRGGMGVVLRAEDELLGRPVAIKAVEIPDAVAEGERAAIRARVLREARAAARLNHPGVVTIHDIVEDGGQVYIVMELVLAPTLTTVVEQHGPLPVARAAWIGRQLLDALEVAHQAGIVHRDVKPANVMVLPRDRVKLADFGIASLQGDPQLTSTGIVLGSPAFMAPEQVSGRPSGPPADLWALGATLYWAVEGRVPFQRDDHTAVFAAILTQDPGPMRLAGALEPVIAALLDKVPERRPSGEHLHHLLEQAAAADPATSAPQAAARPPAGATQPAAPPPGAPTTLPGTPAAAPAAPLAMAPGPAAGRPPVRVEFPPEPRSPLPFVVAGSLVLAVLAVLIAWSAGAFGHGGRAKTAAGRSTATTAPAGELATPASNAASAAPTSQPATQAGQASPVGGGAAAGGQAPVALELTKIAPAGQNLPQFWASATNQAGGYRIGVQQVGWTVTAVGPTTYADDSGPPFYSSFEVHSYPASQDPYAQLRRDAASFATAHRNDRYKPIHLTPSWAYRHQPAAGWEFTWVRNGQLTHALEVAFRAGPHTYTVLYRSLDVWWMGGGTTDFVNGFEEAFTPLR